VSCLCAVHQGAFFWRRSDRRARAGQAVAQRADATRFTWVGASPAPGCDQKCLGIDVEHPPFGLEERAGRFAGSTWRGHLELRCICRFLDVYPLATRLGMAGKDAGLRIRVEKALRDEFLEACHRADRPAAQVLRDFMRTYVADAPASTQNEKDK